MNDELYSMINMLLWDLTVAQRNIQILHWNIKDVNFVSMHRYLGEVYDTLNTYIDMTAEQLRFQEQFPQGNLQDAVKYSQIPAISSTKSYSHKEVVCLAISNILALRNDALAITTLGEDSEAYNLLSGFGDQVSYYSKVLYFLRNSLQEDCD